MSPLIACLSFDMRMQVVALCKGSRLRKSFEQHFRIERCTRLVIGRLRSSLDLPYRLQLLGASIRVWRSAQGARGGFNGEQRSALGAISDPFKESLAARAVVSVAASLCTMAPSQESMVRRATLVGLSANQKEECKAMCTRLLNAM